MERNKHKKVIHGHIPECDIDDSLEHLKQSIIGLEDKQQHLICEWIHTWANYISYEKSFEPSRLMKYKRGDIVLIEMGYNVGSEQGGKRYAVVIEKNPLTRPVVTIVPIATLGGSKTKESLHRSEVFLGEIIPGADSYAIPLHARAISKLRIIKPKAPPAIARLSSEQMDAIDAIIETYFTKKNQ